MLTGGGLLNNFPTSSMAGSTGGHYAQSESDRNTVLPVVIALVGPNRSRHRRSGKGRLTLMLARKSTTTTLMFTTGAGGCRTRAGGEKAAAVGSTGEAEWWWWVGGEHSCTTSSVAASQSCKSTRWFACLAMPSTSFSQVNKVEKCLGMLVFPDAKGLIQWSLEPNTSISF